jgi:hypothetical protein
VGKKAEEKTDNSKTFGVQAHIMQINKGLSAIYFIYYFE